jgi:polyferredoxin
MSQAFLGTLLPNSYFKVFKTGAIYQGPLKGVCVPGLNCVACPTTFCSCPIGSLQNFVASRELPFFLIGYLGILGLIGGRIACGWLCPFGWFQDILYKIKSRKFRLPRFFSYFKYGFLVILVFLLPFLTSENWFSHICPQGALEGTLPWIAWNPTNLHTNQPVLAYSTFGIWFWIKIALLTLFLILFVVIKRPFCRIVCPLGAIYSLFNKHSIITLKVSGDCNRCNLCERVCPMDLKVYEDPNHPDCIRCLKCTQCSNVRLTHILQYQEQEWRNE